MGLNQKKKPKEIWLCSQRLKRYRLLTLKNWSSCGLRSLICFIKLTQNVNWSNNISFGDSNNISNLSVDITIWPAPTSGYSAKTFLFWTCKKKSQTFYQPWCIFELNGVYHLKDFPCHLVTCSPHIPIPHPLAKNPSCNLVLSPSKFRSFKTYQHKAQTSYIQLWLVPEAVNPCFHCTWTLVWVHWYV